MSNRMIDAKNGFLKFLLVKECVVYAHFCLVYNSMCFFNFFLFLNRKQADKDFSWLISSCSVVRDFRVIASIRAIFPAIRGYFVTIYSNICN